jgi:phage-related protein
MDGVVFYINVIIDYECAFDYRNMIIDLSGGSKNKTKQNKTKKKKKKTFTNVCMGYHVSKCKKKKKKKYQLLTCAYS